MPTLSHTGHDEFTLTVKHNVDGFVKALVQLRNQSQHGLSLILDTLAAHL